MDWGADLHHTPMQIVWIDELNCLELGNKVFVFFFCVWPNYCQITIDHSGAEMEFVTHVTHGESVKFLPAV